MHLQLHPRYTLQNNSKKPSGGCLLRLLPMWRLFFFFVRKGGEGRGLKTMLKVFLCWDLREFHTAWFYLQNLRPEIPRCCPSSLANIMRKCWDASAEKRPEMSEVVRMLESIDTSKGGGMIPEDQKSGCFCFTPARGPWVSCFSFFFSPSCRHFFLKKKKI